MLGRITSQLAQNIWYSRARVLWLLPRISKLAYSFSTRSQTSFHLSNAFSDSVRRLIHAFALFGSTEGLYSSSSCLRSSSAMVVDMATSPHIGKIRRALPDARIQMQPQLLPV